MLKKIFFLFLFTTGSLSAQELRYTVHLRSCQTHKVQVEIELKKCGAQTVTYQMPIWAPGAYSVTHYGHYVSDLSAFDSHGKQLNVTQVNGDRWEISHALYIKKISYFVSDSHKDSTSLYFALANIDTNFFFANGTCLFGYVNDNKKIRSAVIYDFPESWQLATALDPGIAFPNIYEQHPTFDVRTFGAKNYDELADAPVMAGIGLQTRTFQDGKAWYDIVVASDKPFPMDSLEENTQKIVHAETEFFHDTPFDHYTFLIFAPSYNKSPSAGQGALEHANSSAYLLLNLPWKIFKNFGPEILSHEFFHLWNVKRIHSSLLGPFDYTQRVKTTSLWLSEGITDYYAHTILTRWGIRPYGSFEQELGRLIQDMNHSSAAKSETLEQLSIDESDFALDKALIFYSKGTLVGLMLDIEIRSRTNNKKSLDDVMLALNAEAKKGKTFKDQELIDKMEKITGLNLQNFYKKYIAGTDSLPIDEYLKKMGVGDIDTSHITESEFYAGDNFLSNLRPTQTESHGDDLPEFIFYKIPSASALEKAGFQMNDTLKMINGEQVTMEKFLDVGKNFKPPVSYDIEVARPSGRKTLHLVYDKPREGDHPATSKRKAIQHYSVMPTASPLEVAIRHGIVGKDY
jgi:predicted metalloprotease with PDZ domain